MDKLIEQLPQIITAAAQSYLGIMALLSVALAVLAYFFFASASEKVKVGIFVLLFLGVAGFGAAMFRRNRGQTTVSRVRVVEQHSGVQLWPLQWPSGFPGGRRSPQLAPSAAGHGERLGLIASRGA